MSIYLYFYSHLQSGSSRSFKRPPPALHIPLQDLSSFYSISFILPQIFWLCVCVRICALRLKLVTGIFFKVKAVCTVWQTTINLCIYPFSLVQSTWAFAPNIFALMSDFLRARAYTARYIYVHTGATIKLTLRNRCDLSIFYLALLCVRINSHQRLNRRPSQQLFSLISFILFSFWKRDEIVLSYLLRLFLNYWALLFMDVCLCVCTNGQMSSKMAHFVSFIYAFDDDQQRT